MPLGCGCFTAVVLSIAVFGAGIFFFVTSLLKNSDPYQHALGEVRSNPEATAALGEPIEEGWMASGNISLNGSSGNADLAIPVSGSKSSGDIYVVATKSGGRWTYSTLRLEVDGSPDSIDLTQGGVEGVLAEPDVLIEDTGNSGAE